eukprot:TRINITY_DN1307_c0_g1_i1.p2 TRINITY_DN1307_c0_g1~~TRINITY_DN1307_c0_g1_i1.p2  ORF type:complete len:399 (-),score=113.85 TRINITY_DN1307_c0_g1_i1:1670-2824(-)
MNNNTAKKAIELWKLQKTYDFLESVNPHEKKLLTCIIGGGVTVQALKGAFSSCPLATDASFKQWAARIEKEFNYFPGKKTPTNGIFFFISMVSGLNVHVAFEPAFPIPSKSLPEDGILLKIERHFQLKPLQDIISHAVTAVAFVFIDHSGASIFVVKGSKIEVLQRVATYLPRNNKMQMMNAVKTLVQKVGQMASQELVVDGKPIVKYIVYGGTYDFRSEMKIEMFEENVRPLVVKLVEISSASEEEIPGAIVKCIDTLSPSIRFAEEISILQEFFRNAAVVSGPKDVMDNVEKKLVEKVLIDVNKPLIRFTLKSPKDKKVVYEEQARNFSPYEIVNRCDLIEYLLDHQAELKINEIQLITNPNSPEAFKFTHASEGIGGFLRA